jgi:hypothetical protein
VTSEDETQQSAERSSGIRRDPRALMRGAWRRGAWLWRIAGAVSRSEPKPAVVESNVHAALRALPALLDGSSLPNGVVELLIEDLEAPMHQMFDINDGRIALVEPGQCAPWVSIAGPPTAWAMALGPERDTTELRLTGDEQLARRVLAALPRASRALGP